MRDFQAPGRSAVYGEKHMVATSHPVASAIAINVLNDGGNAVDAALAASAALCLAEPHMTGIGGDCFAIYAPANGKPVALNGSGFAPAASDPDRLLGQGLSEIPGDSADAVTVPGAIDAWCRLHEDYGSMPLDRIFTPAIELAESGCIVSPRVAFDWGNHAGRLAASPSARSHFLAGGGPLKVGDRFANPALAQTFRLIAARGRRGFYEGAVADAIVGFLKGLGGVHTVDDFAAQASIYVDPIQASYQGHAVYECPPNGQGVIALLILKILERFEHSTGLSEVDRVHLLAEATKLAYAQRDAIVGDPVLSPDAGDILLATDLADNLAGQISLGQALPDRPIEGTEHKDTIYLCVVDKDGNAISFINSLFNAFGSALYEQKTGVLLHSRGTGFRLEAGHPNRLGPNRRPLHTIIPAMVFDDDKAVAPFGVMGGHYQATGHANLLSRVLQQGLDLQHALDLPRSFAYGGPLVLETGYDDTTARALVERGHEVKRAPGPLGGGQVIWIDRRRGILTAASDPRKDGCALGI